MIRVADYIIERLAEERIQYIFMVTGRGILYLSDAVAKCKDIESISVHHEQAGAYAAMAYAQTTGQAGACLVSTGCGATNAITGVLCAWQDSIPCIFISGQNMLRETTRYTGLSIRTYGSQEADIVSLVQPITKYATMLTKAEDIAVEMDKAIYLMKSGRKGPVWIDVPLEIQNMRVEPEKLKRFSAEVEKNEKVNELTKEVKDIAEELNEAKRPVILIGNGVRLSGAVEEFRRLVDRMQIPVVYAPSAADIYGSGTRLGIGTVGSLGGTREGNFVVQNADYILSLGCSLQSVLTGGQPEKFAREAKISVVDIDEMQHKKNGIKIDRLLVADAKEFIDELLKCSLTQVEKAWIDKCLHWKEMFPLGKEKQEENEKIDLYFFAEHLSEMLSEETTVVCDAGFEQLIIPAAVHYKERQRCIQPASQGAMGYALPAAIGAYYANKKPVVAVVGDGSIMMNLQELQTIVYHQLPIKILVINNNVYSVIRRRQRDLFRDRIIGTNPDNGVSCPEFEKVATCFGLNYQKVNNVREFLHKLPNILKQDGGVLCELMCVEEQRYLHASIARNNANRIVKRPLEDLSPFMERELFLREMIIEPIDL